MTKARLAPLDTARSADAAGTVEADGALGNGDRRHGARHVAIIMDGNGRWAKKRSLPHSIGHKKGVDALRNVTRAARSIGLESLTLFAFSSENWRRPEDEIADLMGLLRLFIRTEITELVKENVRLRVIGDHNAFAPDLTAMIDDALARTAANDGPKLNVALNYGGQDEIVRAARAIARKAAAGEIDPRSIDAATIEDTLDTVGLPPLDLVIRTSGEQRLSNFLLWQAAYAELYFTDILWPDFTPDDFYAALADFGQRQRRYGGR